MRMADDDRRLEKNNEVGRNSCRLLRELHTVKTVL